MVEDEKQEGWEFFEGVDVLCLLDGGLGHVSFTDKVARYC